MKKQHLKSSISTEHNPDQLRLERLISRHGWQACGMSILRTLQLFSDRDVLDGASSKISLQ